MKRSHKILLFLLCIIIFMGIGGYISYKYVEEYNINLSKYNLKKEYKDICENTDFEDLTYNEKDICTNMYPYEDGFMYAHSMIVVKYLNLLPIVIIIIIIGFAIIYPSLLINSRFFINELSRRKYIKVVFNIIGNSYIYIIPILLMVLLIFGVEIYNYGFDNTFSVLNNTSLWSEYALRHQFVFILSYVLNVGLFIATYINIGLLSVRKCKKFFSSLISAFLGIVVIQLIFEVFIKKENIISVINIFRYYDTNGFVMPLIFSFVCWLVTFILVFTAYHNKEKMVNDYNETERNE